VKNKTNTSDIGWCKDTHFQLHCGGLDEPLGFGVRTVVKNKTNVSEFLREL
jgi:hypothetical protein